MMLNPEQPGPLAKLATFVVGAVLLVLGFMFSVVLLAVVAVAGLCAWGYFWWKTRELRKAMREQQQEQGQGQAQARPGGQVFEGEAVVVEETRVRIGEVLPRDSHLNQ